MEWVAMCWMSKSVVPVPVFFRVLVIYCQDAFKISKFTNMGRIFSCPCMLRHPYCWVEILNFSVSKQSMVAWCYPWKTEFFWQSWQEQNIREVAFSLNHGLCCWTCVFSPSPCPLIEIKFFSAVRIIPELAYRH